MAEGRTGKSIRNAFAGAGSYFIVLVLGFVTRTALIKGLSDYYLGLNGVMINLIGVFNMAELGLGAAITYSMYKPIADGDQSKAETYVGVFRLVYRVIGAALVVITLGIAPFLGKIANTDPTPEVYAIYALFTGKTVLSYWAFSYRGSLLHASQEKHLVSATEAIGAIVANLGQAYCFWVLHDYLAGLVFLVVGQLAQNLALLVITRQKYPTFNFKSRSHLSKDERSALIRNVYSLSIGKFSNVATNNLSGIIVSAFVGLLESGHYSNYQMITSAVTNLTMQFFSSITSSVGNLSVLATKDEQERVFDRIQFIAVWVYLTLAACIWTATDAFVAAWAGTDHLLTRLCVAGMVVNQLTSGLMQASVLFRDGCGLFYQGRYRPLIGGTLTIVLSLALVKPLGIAGVIWAAPISRTLVTLWFDPYIVYKYVFKKGPWSCYRKMAEYSAVALVSIVLASLLCMLLPKYGLLAFVARGALTIVVVQIVWSLIYGHSDEYRYLLDLIKRLTGKRASAA